MLRKAVSLTLTVLLAASVAPARAEAEAEVNVLVLRENGVGSAATAQTYIDALMVHVARANGWSAAKGVYHTKRAAAKGYIEASKPHFGILSLGAFLALRQALGLVVVGQAEVEGGGGLQYYVVSASQTELAGCKGKSLATNHGGDAQFIDKVVGKGAFTLGDFTVDTTTRPVQTLKKVISGESVCALVDDAQLGELARIEGGAQVRPVWYSALLPPMPIVAFGDAPVDERKHFSATLGAVCTGEGAAACASAGIKSLRTSDATPYADVIAAWSEK